MIHIYIYIYIANFDNKGEGKTDSLTLHIVKKKLHNMKKKILEIFEIKIAYLNFLSFFERRLFSIFK
jgi:hypothetical protein